MATFQRQTIQPVATCRQTVEAYLATPHRLAADGYVSAPNNSARSHLSPDGGSLPRHAPTAWQPIATIRARKGSDNLWRNTP
jgi:hypothetical protein